MLAGACICTYQGERTKERNAHNTRTSTKRLWHQILPNSFHLYVPWPPGTTPWMLEPPSPDAHTAGVLTMLASARTKERRRHKHTTHQHQQQDCDHRYCQLLLCLLTLTTRGHPLDARGTKHMKRVAFLPIWTFLLLPFFLLLCTHNTRTSTKRLWT